MDSFTERMAMLRNDNGAGLEDEYAVSGGMEGGRGGWCGGREEVEGEGRMV